MRTSTPKVTTPSCCRRKDPTDHVWEPYPADRRYEFCRRWGCGHARLIKPRRRRMAPSPVRPLRADPVSLWGEQQPAIDLSTRAGKREMREWMSRREIMLKASASI